MVSRDSTIKIWRSKDSRCSKLGSGEDFNPRTSRGIIKDV